MGAVDRRPAEVQGVRPAEFGEENLVETRPHTGLGPLGQAPASGSYLNGSRVPAAVLPGDPGVQDEQDALEYQPVRMPLASRMPDPTLHLWAVRRAREKR